MKNKKIILKKNSKTSIEQEIKQEILTDALIKGYGKSASNESKNIFLETFPKYLRQEIIKHHSKVYEYNILILFDNTVLMKGDSDQMYRSVTKFSDLNKPLLLVLLSGGGEPGSAYLIGRLCREFSNGKFVVVVPRHAKSAATLLACAGDEIHMGRLSELGPIDPQINGMPALGLKNSIEHIAELVNKSPSSSEMFARYLKLTVKPVEIGYYERVAESAVQYCERLLEKHKNSLTNEPSVIAFNLVYGYKDHGFVIDKKEATNIFGDKTIKCNTKEYELGNTIYNILSKFERLADILDYNLYFIGSLDSSPNLVKKIRR